MSGDDVFWDEPLQGYADDAVEYKRAVQEDMLVELMEEMNFSDIYIAHSLDVFRSQFSE